MKSGYAKAIRVRRFNETLNILNPSYSVPDKKWNGGTTLAFKNLRGYMGLGFPKRLSLVNN
jgi:hypothetical protein